jgi:hypothetical protein
MKKSLFILFFILATSTFAQESAMCVYVLGNIDRTITNLEQQGNNVSYLEKEKLYRDMRLNADLCLKSCQGEKFAYCNKLIQFIDNGR